MCTVIIVKNRSCAKLFYSVLYIRQLACSVSIHASYAEKMKNNSYMLPISLSSTCIEAGRRTLKLKLFRENGPCQTES